MNFTLLDHQKAIIMNVCKDKSLFEKELVKSMEWLNEREQKQFRKWIWENFMLDYPDVLKSVFRDELPELNKTTKRHRIHSETFQTV